MEKSFVKRLPEKLRNPYFILGLFATILNAANVDFTTLTSWPLLGDALLGILSNPVSLGAAFVSVLAMWNDNSTPGLDRFRLTTKKR